MRASHQALSRLANVVSFGRIKIGWWSSPYRSAASPIIIGGSPRTGTTLLRVILDNHPDVWIGPENGIFQEGGSNFEGMQACLGLPIQTLKAVHRRSSCLGEFVDLSLGLALERQGKRIWGIKSPSVVYALDNLFHFFPEARFIHIVRDGRDVVCSLRTFPKDRIVDGRRVPTGIVNPWPSCVDAWVKSTTAGLRWRNTRQYYELRYEDLVASPEATLRELLDWLGLPYDPGIWRYYTRPVNEGIDAPHPGISQQVYRSAVSRWRTELPADAYSAFTQDACDLLVRFGYEPSPTAWKRSTPTQGAS